MDPTATIDALEAATGVGEARRILAAARQTPGLSRAFAERVVQRLGESHGLARRLASRWPLVLRYGDERAPVYRVQGIADRLEGRWERSAEAFRRAGRHARDPVQRLALQIGAVDGLARAGRVTEAVALGDRLARGLRRAGAEDQAARVETNVGNALLWIDAYARARSRLARALPVLDRSGHQVEAAAAGLALSTAEIYGGDPATGRAHAEAARSKFVAAGLSHYAELCKVNLAQADLMQGRADEALDRLLELRASLEDHPAEKGRILEFLGDAYLRLNLYEEAVASYREALRALGMDAPLNRANCRLGLGAALGELGDVRSARKSLAAAEAGFRSVGNLVWAGDAAIALARLDHRTGRRAAALDRALRAFAEMRAAGPYHRARARIVSAMLGAPDDLRGALVAARGYGFGDLEWQVHWTRARRGGPRRLVAYRRMLECLLEARMLTRSTLSRAAFLRDKSEALSDYLGALLERPTPAKTREALEVVSRCRSAALVDEVLSSRAAELGADVRQGLEDLRSELASLGVDESLGGGRRREARSDRLAALRARWVALTRTAQRLAAPDAAAPPEDNLVFVEAGDGYHALRGDEARRLPWTKKELAAKLRWLQFEMSAPIAEGPAAAAGPVRALLRDLAGPLLELADGARGVSPDGLLWSLPFSALNEGFEQVVVPSPSFAAPLASGLPQEPRTALWYFAPPDLPEVEREAEAFMARFPNATVCRTAAEVRDALDGPDVDLLHVATHATFRRSNPMFSELWFGDGAVYAADIARARMRVGMATLSACDTGAMALATREEPDGFVRAFLARGSRFVLASLWPLDDQIAPLAMSHYYRRLVGGDVRSALQAAREAARQERSHPYYWGGLTLFGGYHKEKKQ